MDFQSWTTPNKLAAFIGISILLLSFYSFFKPEHNFNIMEVEKYKNDTEHFDKWNDLLAKSNVDQILNTYYNQDKLRLLHTINTTVNSSFIYQTDKITFGKSDYWASPLEFVEKLGGDCEDFAIFKYFTLLKAGIPASDMRIVIAKDHIRDNAHAVLVVNVNDLWYVLDNTTFEIKTTDATKHLQTIYQVNNEGIWIHK